MARPQGFDWVSHKNGEVVMTHYGKVAGVLRGRRAVDFQEDVAKGDEQELMARLTGNYKRGNERLARSHPRNQTGR